MRRLPLLLAVPCLALACTSAGDGELADEQAATLPPTTAAAPETTAPAAGSLVVHAVGEVTFDPAVVPGLDGRPEAALAGVGELFTGDGLTIAPLTCAVVPSTLVRPSPCGATALAAMDQAGVDVVVLATDSLAPVDAAATAEAVREAGMTPVGAGVDAAAALEPAVVTVGGRTVAVLAASVVGAEEGFAAEDRAGVADGRSILALGAVVAEAATTADLVVVSMHWGEEQSQAPRTEDIDLARALVDAGADVVVGHGPHRLHRLEAYGAGVLFLSLGDFVGPGDPPPTADTAVARVVWSDGAPLIGCLLHATIATPGEPTLDEPPGTRCPGES